MQVTVYTEQLKELESFELKAGELAVFAYGGHGYEILEDDTQIIETKWAVYRC